MIEEVLYSQPEIGNNYQVYTGSGMLRIDAELRPGRGDPDAAQQRVVQLLESRGLRAELTWVEHIPRVGGKTRRVRPLADREAVMAAVSLLKRD